MSWVGDVFNFEKFNLGNIGKKISKNPEQLLIGAGDPFSAGVWSKVTGKDYEPLVNQWGGATDDTYQKAQESGINTGPGKSMHGIAQAIAGTFAGGYGAGQAGGLLGQGGGAAGAQGATTGAQSGGIGGAFNTFNQYAKPVSQGIGYAQQAQGLLGGQQQQPMQAPQLPQGGQVDVSGILGAQNQQQAQLEAQRAARRARQPGILGGYYG